MARHRGRVGHFCLVSDSTTGRERRCGLTPLRRRRVADERLGPRRLSPRSRALSGRCDRREWPGTGGDPGAAPRDADRFRGATAWRKTLGLWGGEYMTQHVRWRGPRRELANLTDEQLTERARGGDNRAFGELFRRHRKAAESTARYRCARPRTRSRRDVVADIAARQRPRRHRQRRPRPAGHDLSDGPRRLPPISA